MNLITRAEWGARHSRGASTLASTRGVKIHYAGDTANPGMRADHRLCFAMVRAIQDSHMDERKWNDIAYNLLVCVHGDVFEGRGPHILCAANGEGLNTAHYAVCGLVGSKGLTVPSPEMYAGLCDAIGYLRSKGDAGGEVKGHRDGYATDCPGKYLYQWVKDGAPCPDEGDDVPSKVSLGLGKAQTCPADVWTVLTWGAEVSDKEHQHADAGGPSVLNGPAEYRITAYLTLDGMPVGADYQMRAVEVDADGKAATETGPILEGKATDGHTYALYNLAADTVGEGRRVQVQVKPLGHAATASAGTCKVSFSR